MTHTLKLSTFDIWGIIMQARAVAYNVRRKELIEQDLTPEQAGILNILHKGKNRIITPALIAKEYLREPHTISVILKRMEEKGLIALNKNLTRRNMIRVTLTEKGDAARADAFRLDRTSKLFKNLSDDETKTLYSLLTKVMANAAEALAESESDANRDLSIFHEYDNKIQSENFP
ncbi:MULTISPECIES: MarR family winged helix-turn-helix transcriptional regulator [Dehalococcoides]|jgi:DNA-binding MarR family transcriptional regulator|uniref:MarR family winged helix-turn-helix transcriptional regulator n=1 Tax=Dehalococcoides TaxID=61434 RepID=UPI0003C89725|nr:MULTISPECIES: MarR family transcriptional regulator [Dehalococcoides]AHB14197.1 MarR family transcriptional regulator [Dehalococcoides mccartyi GY50]AII58548.1 MarR family transcriptional regulator [Dehalococcoides mccartyi CG1]APH11669.1 MarR family transcriptional regulator [Dehalococcoides mccartyi]QYY58726.1 MarR family transcriptional regulator [Dehalococcoides mccartyi]BAQ35372.1 MarR family transcriptional regulator [Dehalococcoides sp. UCH007]